MSRARVYRVSALLIRQRNFGEADRIVTLLTRERGKLSAIAKGVKKARSKFAGGLQLFSLARLQLAVGRSLEVVTQVEPTAGFYHLREDLGRFAHASYLCELVDVLTEEQAPDSAIFDLLVAALGALDAGGDPPTVTRGFELKLLTHLGYGPEMNTCVACGTEVEGGEAGFSAAEGGILCQSCRRGQGAPELGAGTLAAMRDLIRLPLEELAGRRLKAGVQQELERIMRAYVDYRLERPLRSTALLVR